MPKGGIIADLVAQESLKLIRRHQRYASELHDELQRRERRTGVVQPKVVHTPNYWSLSRGFNPYLVRRASKSIGYALASALDNGAYSPRPAVDYRVPKNGGGERPISVFQIADNAISRRVYHSLVEKNAARLSGRCYAYRPDVTIHDAAAHIRAELGANQRIFVAEFDFKKFFESLTHDHFTRVLSDHGFLTTRRERAIVEAFLQVPTLPFAQYSESSRVRRTRGMPQGTSISLFLANAAASVLDRRLERLGIGFARYADDTLIWSTEYSELCRAVDVLSDALELMGVEVNIEKSPGVRILSRDDMAHEMRSTKRVEFVGYALDSGKLTFKEAKVAAIKRQIAYIIYSNLIQPIRRNTFDPRRFRPNLDRDYYMAVIQIRRLIYGDLSEQRVRAYSRLPPRRRRFRGLMSYFPLIEDVDRLRVLDGWMLHTIWCALRLRTRLLSALGHTDLPTPHRRPRQSLLTVVETSTSTGAQIDASIPSFRRMAMIIAKASRAYGPNVVANIKSVEYYRDTQ